MKAHRKRRLTYHDIVIETLGQINGRSQAPRMVIVNKKGSWEEGQHVRCSISHDGSYATAVVMAFEDVSAEEK